MWFAARCGVAVLVFACLAASQENESRARSGEDLSLLTPPMLIELLGDPDWATREAATQELAARADEVEASLQRAVGSADLEVSLRARSLLADRSRAGDRQALGEAIAQGRKGDLEPALLALSALADEELDAQKAQATLGVWGDELAGRIGRETEPATVLRRVGDYLIRVRGFRPLSQLDPRATTLAGALDERVIEPETLALLALVLGERAGLELHFARCPDRALISLSERGPWIDLQGEGKVHDREQLEQLDITLPGVLIGPQELERRSTGEILLRHASQLALRLRMRGWQERAQAIEALVDEVVRGGEGSPAAGSPDQDGELDE